MKKSLIALSALGFLIFSTVQMVVAQTYQDENVILGRPTDDSIAIHVRAPEGTEVFAEYGDSPGVYTGRTATARTSVDNLI